MQVPADDMPATNAQKRPAELEAEDDTVYDLDPLENSASKPMMSHKRLRFHQLDYPAPEQHGQVLIIHHVHCLQQAAGHELHVEDALFADTPRLYKGDSKASALRGTNPLYDNIPQYLEEHPELVIVIYREYDCQAYQNLLRDDFDQLDIPRVDAALVARLKPYFFELREDGEPARPYEERMEIVSLELRRAVRIIAGQFPGNFVDWDSETNMRAPYLAFYHCRSLLTSPVSESLGGRQRGALEILLMYLRSAHGAEHERTDELFAMGQVSRNRLAMLFGANEIIVTNEDNHQVTYVIKRSEWDGADTIHLACYRWAFNGSFYREEKEITVAWPNQRTDLVNIRSLEAYPLRFDDSGAEERLKKRGRMFWDCRKSALVGYDAPRRSFELQVTNPRYMVDTATYRLLHPDESQATSGRDDLGIEAMEKNEPPEDPFLLLLPPTVKGFGFHDKKWRTLSVEHLRKVTWNKKAFSRLVLDGDKKELIRALVTVHVSMDQSMDVIEGKGNGLIMLLHGGPGTGKTLTGESVAELAEKPLYRVTCGDIGTDPEAVEKYLESVLYIGTIWKCVVLLDEADVFLEERTQTDMQRNALVSVFLRVLDYYDGILILTSNRVGTFDEAFKSRVQLALHYPPLETIGRVEIWSNFINSLKDAFEGPSFEELRNKLDTLARHPLNGRQIRNAVKTARQLAFYKEQNLEYKHLEQAIKVANEFEKYVEDTHGHTDAEWAREQRTRLE